MPKIIKVKNHWRWNIQTKECQFSDSWCRNLGYEPNELAHHEDTWQSLVHKDCMPKVWAKLAPVISGKIELYKCKYRLRDKNNKYIWHLDIGRVTRRDKNGEAVIMEGNDIRIAA